MTLSLRPFPGENVLLAKVSLFIYRLQFNTCRVRRTDGIYTVPTPHWEGELLAAGQRLRATLPLAEPAVREQTTRQKTREAPHEKTSYTWSWSSSTTTNAAAQSGYAIIEARAIESALAHT